MAEETYPAILQAMIDRAAEITPDEAKKLGEMWESYEDLVLPEPSLALQLFGGVDVPVITNEALLGAWQRASDAAIRADRLTELEAARAAGRAATRDVRFDGDTEAEKNGTEQAVRAAVLAVGLIDLLPKADYFTLVTPWQQVLGTTLVEHNN